MDEVAVPGILAYKGGDCFANIVSFLSEIPNGTAINVQTVQNVLERCVRTALLTNAFFLMKRDTPLL